MKKTLLVLTVIFILVGALFVSLSANSFTDVSKDAYYAEAAERMAEKGILSGFGDGRFYGEWELTRAQFAALACKLLGKVDEANALAGETAFADVPGTHWSTGYVNYAVANKIINGDGDGNFRPDDSVKYEEAIKVIVCVLNSDKTIEIDPSDWSKNFIEEAERLGITNNLIGKKGESMKRSDIAVIADAAYVILKESESIEDIEKTNKPSSPDKPTSNKPAETTIESKTAESTTAETEFTLRPFVDSGNFLPPEYEE